MISTFCWAYLHPSQCGSLQKKTPNQHERVIIIHKANAARSGDQIVLSIDLHNVTSGNLQLFKTQPFHFIIVILFFSFTEDNGAFRQETGTQEFDGQGDVNVVRGSYSYVSPEGELIEVSAP